LTFKKKKKNFLIKIPHKIIFQTVRGGEFKEN